MSYSYPVIQTSQPKFMDSFMTFMTFLGKIVCKILCHNLMESMLFHSNFSEIAATVASNKEDLNMNVCGFATDSMPLSI